jgi:membrane fusion protein, multidrug efflux system
MCKGMRYALTLAALILTVGILAGLKGAQIATLIGFGKEMERLGPQPEAVNAARAEEQKWEQALRAVASVVSSQGLALSNDASGIVTELTFESGARVRKGERLLSLDSSVERAQLASLRARLKLAAVSLRRTRRLTAAGANSQAELDAEQSSFNSLSADAESLAALIEKKTIRAPFSGKLGIRQVNLGQYLAPGTPITVLESDEEAFVDFSLPQQDLRRVALGQEVRVRAAPDTPQLAEARVTAIDAAVDEVTRSIRVRASVVDAEARLQSGMFVNVEVLLPERAEVVAVPATAVVHAAHGSSLFVVEVTPAVRIARQQFVRLGETRGDYIAVLEGIRPGDEVVTAGAFKLRNGAPISVENDVGLDAEQAPRPEDR